MDDLYGVINVPGLNGLSPEGLYNFTKVIEARVDRWDRVLNKQIEGTFVRGFGLDERKAEAKILCEFITSLSTHDHDCMYPVIQLQDGSNEGYRVNLMLMVNSNDLPASCNYSFDILSVKLWSRDTQYELYEFLVSILAW